MVVVQVYFPDTQYNSTSEAESYSQLLGAKAAMVTKGTPAGRWRLGMAPPKPDSAQLQHPRRLLMADLETHLAHYALCSWPELHAGPYGRYKYRPLHED